MSKPARWSIFASLFALWLGACGDDDKSGPGETAGPTTSCITLTGMTCSCPSGGYGTFACDGSCTMCAPTPAGTSGGAGTGSGAGMGAAGGGLTGFAGRSGGSGRGGVPAAGAPGTGTGSGRGGAGTSGFPGAAGRGTTPPAAGSGAMMPAAGAMAGAAGMPATTTGDVPATPACMAASTWNADWAGFEVEVLRLVNENRAKGWNCDTKGMFAAAPALTMEPTLRCSARLHSKDMADRMFFAHETPEGVDPGKRMAAAGYVGRGWGENIAKGQTSAAQVVAGWMDSDGHCSNIMSPSFTLIGVGYFAGMGTNPRFNSELYWTQNFGAAAAGGRR